MKRYIFILSALVITAASCVKDKVTPVSTGPVVLGDRKLIHYWSFNTGTDSISMSVPDTTIGGGFITYSCAHNGYIDAVTPGSGLNLRHGADTGAGMRVRNPYYSWVLHIPTTGYKQPIIQFSLEKSSSGPTSSTISYTIDGINYISTGIPTALAFTIAWTEASLDFSAIPEVNDNPKFAIKFSNAIADTSGGNDRFDNISIDAFVK